MDTPTPPTNALMSFLNTIFTPSAPVLILGAAIVLFMPLLVHLFLTRATPYTSLPSILLVGPSGAGKTSLLTLLERGPTSTSAQPAVAAQTHTSQIPSAIQLSVSEDGSSSWRKDLDASGSTAKSFLLVDTPGHGKLRNTALAKLSGTKAKGDKAAKIKGVVFMLDAADADILAVDGAEYLYDVLLSLQKRTAGTKTKGSTFPVLIAANKEDLFTALPASLVKSRLEAELGRIRKTRSKGLLEASVGTDEVDVPEEGDDWLGEYGSETFRFDQMREFDVEVEVHGGNVVGEGQGVDKWWRWIAEKI
jgi:signal recognition particle receptor subunit beta